MALLIECPNCGSRDVHEFRHGGEISDLSERKVISDSDLELTKYFYFARNNAGDSKEWWYHSFGCRQWFVAYRNTVSDQIRETEWPEKRLDS